MILEPILAVSSFSFYRRVAAQPWWRSLLYLGYLSVLFALIATIGLKIQAGPHIDATFVWLEKSAPTLTFANGKMTSSLTEALILRHPEYPEIGLVVDTNRVEPVTAKMLDEAKAQAYLSSNAFYMVEPQHPGQMKVYDFSKSNDPKPVTLDAAFYENAHQVFNRLLYPAVFAGGVLLVIAWKIASTITYALLALLLNALASGQLGFGALAAVALYAQTPAILFTSLVMVFALPVPKLPFISMVLTGAYIWFAIKKLGEPDAAPAAAAPPAA
jgi:hypothetical protein